MFLLDKPFGAAMPVSKIFIVPVVETGVALGVAVACELIENVIVLVPVPVPLVYVCANLAPCVPPATVVLAIASELPSPQLALNVATTSFAFVDVLSRYIAWLIFASVITLPPDDAL